MDQARAAIRWPQILVFGLSWGALGVVIPLLIFPATSLGQMVALSMLFGGLGVGAAGSGRPSLGQSAAVAWRMRDAAGFVAGVAILLATGWYALRGGLGAAAWSSGGWVPLQETLYAGLLVIGLAVVASAVIALAILTGIRILAGWEQTR